ncbi:TetR/AcrR family transcriptional regulator [Hyphococcus sp.]|uniref:TetR/AcrR family transcriptional regulator n=1 Tax=Hyphococcus sp. TaxID=2038636 RepID=UPI003CCC05E7
MSGLRARSKQRRRDLVLDAAEVLFRRQGYGRTTIEEIASEADVSIGTMYKYFGSKSGIMRALMEPVIFDMLAKGKAVIANPPKRAVDAIAALYEAYRFTNEWKHVNILRAFDPRFEPLDENLTQITDAFDTKLTAQIAEMLSRLQELGRLSRIVDAEDGAFILYNLLRTAFNAHVTISNTQTYEEILVDTHRRMRLIFESWSGDGG